ncbi:hypothetical protein J3R83DRAFT_13303 [Lanmaoa asiatica]|nr:hypothetical protein J3R83DRAFT_13303 [Lanmaoa asiatica]
MSETKVKALREVLTDRDPRLDFAHATPEGLEALSQACQPASFGINNKDILDETYRKAGKMDLDAFATLFDPRTLGIHDAIERDLLATDQTVEFELSKLNVYELTKTPLVRTACSVRWSSSSLPLTRVQPPLSGSEQHFSRNLQPIPRQVESKVDRARQRRRGRSRMGVTLDSDFAINTSTTRPSRSTRCSTNSKDLTQRLPTYAKSWVYPTLRLLYAQEQDIDWPHFHLLSRVKLNGPAPIHSVGYDGELVLRPGLSDGYDDDNLHRLLWRVVEDLGPEDIEGVQIIGRRLDPACGLDEMGERGIHHFMQEYYKNPVPQVLEVKEMSSVLCETAYACYGNYVYMDRFYATACMMISTKPRESRERLSL